MSTNSTENATMKKRVSKRDGPEEQLQKAIAHCEERYLRWQHLYTEGGQDPSYTDGVNMQLVRNHIIFTRREIQELCGILGCELPEVYHWPIPDEVPRDYMAQPDRIRENARKALAYLEKHPDYLKLLEVGKTISPKQREKVFYPAVIGYVSYLREDIKRDDLVAMRMRGNPKKYEDSFKSCLERIAKLQPESYQLSLFDISA